MRVGVALPHGVHSGIGFPDWPHLRDLAINLDTAGFDALWVSDHYYLDLQSPGSPPRTGSQLDAMVVLPALAQATHRATLGTLVLTVGFRPPSVLAKAVASLDRLSSGRFVLGLGTGSHQAEFASAGLAFPAPQDRLAELEEAVTVIREMTSRERATVTGRRFWVADAPNLPRAAQATIPILLDGDGPLALRTVARSADVWNVSGPYSPQRYASKKAEFERACDEVGRDPGTVGRSLGLVALVGENEQEVARRFEEWRQQAPGLVQDDSPADAAAYGLVGTPQQVGERVEEFRELGVTDLVLSFSPLMFGWCSAAGWDIVAQELLPV